MMVKCKSLIQVLYVKQQTYQLWFCFLSHSVETQLKKSLSVENWYIDCYIYHTYTCLFYTIQLIYVVNIVLDLTRWRSISNTILFQLYVSWMTTTLIIDLIRIFSYILKRTSLSFEFYLMYFMFIYSLFILRLFRWSSFYHDSVELILILKQIMLLPGQEYDRCYQVILCVWV